MVGLLPRDADYCLNSRTWLISGRICPHFFFVPNAIIPRFRCVASEIRLAVLVDIRFLPPLVSIGKIRRLVSVARRSISAGAQRSGNARSYSGTDRERNLFLIACRSPQPGNLIARQSSRHDFSSRYISANCIVKTRLCRRRSVLKHRT